MTTTAQLEAWLRGDAVPVFLVEANVRVGGVETTRYLSNRPYVGASVYLPVIAGGISTAESLALSGFSGPSSDTATLSTGALLIDNTDGSLDAWLSDVWVNRRVQVWIGDATWAQGDFYRIFDGIVADIGAADVGRLSLRLVDKLQRLNGPISEQTTTENVAIPQAFGEVSNVEPILYNPAQHEYRAHVAALERVIEVRDNGVPVSHTSVTGGFRLTASPAGTITASVQGERSGTYVNDISRIIQRLVTGFGKVSERFTSADLDTANLNAFQAANPQPVGLYVQDRMNVIEACNELAASVGAQIAMSREGKLRLHQIKLPATGPARAITPDGYEEGSLEIVNRSTVRAAVKLAYCKNWTVQESLDTGIPPSSKELFSQEWLHETATNSTVANDYRLTSEPEVEETLLQRKTDAQAEAARRLALWSVPRQVYRVRCYAEYLTLELGQSVQLFGRRFNLDSGVTGMVVGIDADWMGGRVAVEVLA